MQEITFAELDTEMVAMLPSKETLFLNFNWANVYATNSSIALNAANYLLVSLRRPVQFTFFYCLTNML